MKDLVAERSAHIAGATPGVAAARRLSELTDEAVRELARAASHLIDDRWAIMALGGWGAGALQPQSDLDLLVLSDAPSERLKPFVEAVLYPLWDAGLKVGHQVRSPKHQRRAMREDLMTCTAALTARSLAGDAEWAEGAAADWARDAHRRSRGLLRQLADRERPGSPYLLEPDLKGGAGGRRDYDELVWIASIETGTVCRTPAELTALGLLTVQELEALESAASVVAAARWELQRGGSGDRLTLDSATDITATDLETVQMAMGDTALLLGRARARAAGRPTESESPLAAGELEALLRAGAEGAEAVELAAQAGRLESLLPGFRELMACRRPGLGHQLTVGAHSIRCAGLLCEVGGDGPLKSSLEAIDDPRPVMVAALVHDAAKLEGGAEHAERGAEPAAAAAARFGLAPEAARHVGDLVRHHLLLVETALRDDLDDEDAILRCAANIGRRELVAPLHVLCAADSRATGPSTWSPWVAALVATLVSRLEAALSPDVDGAGLATRGEAVRRATIAAMADSASEEVAFVVNAPLRYLSSRSPEEVARHAALVSSLQRDPSGGCVIEVSTGPAEKTHAVTVVAIDRPHLLARVAGAISLAGLDILSLDAYQAPNRVALDSFVVTSATGRAPGPDTFAKLERLVRAALRDRLELATRLQERRRHYPPTARHGVQVRTTRSGWATELKVTAPDRPGLLHDIARAVADSGLEIKWARIQTVDGTAKDVFHLTAPDGAPADDPGLLGHVAMRIRETL